MSFTIEEMQNAIREPAWKSGLLTSEEMYASIGKYLTGLPDLVSDFWEAIMDVDEFQCYGSITCPDTGHEINCMLRDVYRRSLRGVIVQAHPRFEVNIIDYDEGDVISIEKELFSFSDAVFAVSTHIRYMEYNERLRANSQAADFQWTEDHADDIAKAIKQHNK